MSFKEGQALFSPVLIKPLNKNVLFLVKNVFNSDNYLYFFFRQAL